MKMQSGWVKGGDWLSLWKRRRREMLRRAVMRLPVTELLERRQLFSTVYVDASATGPTTDGKGWATAYTDLQVALSTAVSGDQIDVAQGTYYPTTGNDQTATFELKTGVTILGGFAGGTSSNPNSRNVAAYPTILSGDIGQKNNPIDNSQDIVSANGSGGSGTLDGFTLTASASLTGYAESLVISQASPTISNCTFTNGTNESIYGGGYGGGGVVDNFGAATFLGCRFLAVTGRALSVTDATVGVINCVFIGNSGPYYGDSVSAGQGAHLTVMNSTFCDNSGGSTIDVESSVCSVVNSIIWNGGSAANSQISESGGSGMTVQYDDIDGGYPDPTVINVDPMFVRNPSPGTDGSWGTTDDDYGNLNLQAFSPGIDAGFNADLYSYVTTDIAGNPRIQVGPRNGFTASETPVVDLGAYEESPQFLVSAGGPYYIASGHSLVLNGQGTTTASGNLTYSWDFNGDGVFGDAYGSSPLLTSSALPVGTVVPISLKLTDSASRSIVSTTTMTVVSPILYVDSHATGNGSGSDWADAFTSLQTALSQAVTTQQIYVAGGTYYTGTGTNTTATFQLKNNVYLVGGYAGAASPGNPGLRNVAAYPTVLSGMLGTVNGNTYQSAHVVTGATSSSAIMDSFTITSGSDGLYDSYDNPAVSNCTFIACTVYNFESNPAITGATFQNSSGILNQYSNPTVANSTFTNNQVYASGGAVEDYNSRAVYSGDIFTGNSAYADYGGAAYEYISTSIFNNCTFQQNTANLAGGAVYESNSTETFTGCTFIRNKASAFEGGAVENWNSSTAFTNCVFDGNISGSEGGALDFEQQTSSSISNCILIGNHAQTGGGLSTSFSAALKILNCTFTANTAAGAAGAMYINDLAPTIINSIFWLNTGASNNEFNYTLAGTYSDSDASLSGSTNLKSDPLFVQVPSPGADAKWGTADDNYGDLHLQLGSPCIDAGSNTPYGSGVTTDLAGQPRISGAAVDMGAYESNYGGTLSGSLYIDVNGDGNGSDELQAYSAGTEVYIDKNNNGLLDAGEPAAYFDGNGNVTFRNLSAGTYVVRQALSGTPWLQTIPAGNTGVTVTVNVGKTTTFAFANFQLRSVSGNFNTTSATVSGVVPAGTALTISLNSPSGVITTQMVTTDSNGNYLAGNLGPGIVTVTPSVPGGFTVGPTSATAPSISGATSILNFTAVANGVISGTVFSDDNGNGVQDAGELAVSGVPMFLDLLSAPGGAVIQSLFTTTGPGNGNYSFGELLPGDYVIREQLPSNFARCTIPVSGTYALSPFTGGTLTGENFADLPYVPNAPLTGTVIGTSGSYNNDGNTIAKVFDKNFTTYFDAPTGSGNWVGLDLGSPKVITQVSFASRSGWESRMNGGIFQGSNSATFSTGVVNLYTIGAGANPPATSFTNAPVNVPTAYRYVRYVGPANSFCNVSELEFFGITPAPATVAASNFNASGATSLSFTFSGALSKDPGISAVDLENITAATATKVTSINLAETYNAATNTMTITFPGFSGGKLPAGIYSATLIAADITDANGQALAANVSYGFLTLPASGKLTLPVGRGTVSVQQISIPAGAELDLTNNSLILSAGGSAGYNTIYSLLQSGYQNGKWQGSSGIVSSSAAGDSKHLTTLGLVLSTGQNFDQLGTQPGDVLLKFTYYGDTNLDGKVDGSDYSVIDNGYLNHLTGWMNGDLNYDGIVNGSDYTLIDNAYNSQGAAVTAQLASPQARALPQASVTVTLMSQVPDTDASFFSGKSLTGSIDDLLECLDFCRIVKPYLTHHQTKWFDHR